MKIQIYYYSGAGNTLLITKRIQTQLESLKYDVNITRITEKTSVTFTQNADSYIIGFPVYDLSAPQLVKDLVFNLKTENKTISYYCTKAFLSSESIKELSEISEAKGLKTVAKLDLFMPATDALALFAKKDSRTEKVLKSFHSRNINNKISTFIEHIESAKEITIKKKFYSSLSFVIPKKTKKAFHDQYKKYIPEFYSEKDICISCMICVKGCPRDNIRFDDGIKFGLNCDMCLSCLHHCPVDSIQLGKYTQGNVRLRKIEINDK
jgi:ferredoxin